MQDAQRIKIPPVMLIEVEETADVMQARNTARRAASLLGFDTASRAQIAGAVASLVTYHSQCRLARGHSSTWCSSGD